MLYKELLHNIRTFSDKNWVSYHSKTYHNLHIFGLQEHYIVLLLVFSFNIPITKFNHPYFHLSFGKTNLYAFKLEFFLVKKTKFINLQLVKELIIYQFFVN